jgi:hypothetical protein
MASHFFFQCYQTKFRHVEGEAQEVLVEATATWRRIDMRQFDDAAPADTFDVPPLPAAKAEDARACQKENVTVVRILTL